MFYVYVLKSKKDGKLYIGFTNDWRKRFEEHNLGKSLATRNRMPFGLLYYEAYFSGIDARNREIKLKRFKRSYSELKKRLKDSLSKT